MIDRADPQAPQKSFAPDSFSPAHLASYLVDHSEKGSELTDAGIEATKNFKKVVENYAASSPGSLVSRLLLGAERGRMFGLIEGDTSSVVILEANIQDFLGEIVSADKYRVLEGSKNQTGQECHIAIAEPNSGKKFAISYLASDVSPAVLHPDGDTGEVVRLESINRLLGEEASAYKPQPAGSPVEVISESGHAEQFELFPSSTKSQGVVNWNSGRLYISHEYTNQAKQFVQTVHGVLGELPEKHLEISALGIGTGGELLGVINNRAPADGEAKFFILSDELGEDERSMRSAGMLDDSLTRIGGFVSGQVKLAVVGSDGSNLGIITFSKGGTFESRIMTYEAIPAGPYNPSSGIVNLMPLQEVLYPKDKLLRLGADVLRVD